MGLYLNPNADAFMEDGTRLCVFEPLTLSFHATAIRAGAEAVPPRRISRKKSFPSTP